MKLEIPFNKEIYKTQMALNFKETWKKNLNANYRRLFWGIPAPMFGGFLVNAGSYVGFVFIVLGVHFLINFFEYLYQYKTSKDKYWANVENEMYMQIESGIGNFWEFHEDYLGFKDYRYECKINWIAFKNMRIIQKSDKTLFLYLRGGESSSSFILSKAEIGDEKFNHVVEFIQTKIDTKYQ